jgi:hypothetical protein
LEHNNVFFAQKTVLAAEEDFADRMKVADAFSPFSQLANR